MGWLLHFNTGSLRKHEPSVPCSVSLPNNYVIVKKESTYKFLLGFPFKVILCSLAKKSRQNAHFFIHPPLIFATHSLKLVSAIFFFSPNDSPSKTEKCFLFHLKSSLRSQDIQVFGISFYQLMTS